MKKIILLFSLLAVAISGVAQSSTLYSSYYLDRMPLRHKLNAALMPDQNYISLPVIGGINMTLGSNIGMESLLYPSTTESNTLNTFLHPDVSADDALSNLSKYNGMDFQMDINLLSFGFFAWGGYNTFDTNLKVNGSAYIAKDLFAFLKQGQTSDVTNYDLSGTSFSAKAYAEVAFGHSRKITDRLTVGAKFKYLMGFASGNLNLDNSSISLSNNEWIINSGASGNIAMKGATINVDGEDVEFDYNTSNIGLAGKGMAFDFGATYRLFDEIWVLDGLELSAAVNDLGFITWSGGNTTITNNGEFVYTGFEDIDINADDDSENSLDSQLDNLTEDLEGLMDIETISNADKYRQRLVMNFTAGAEAIFLDDRITVGVLYTTHIRENINASHCGVFSLNLKPTRWIMGSVIYSASNYGSNFGGVLNICPRGFNFFLGADYGVPKLTSSYIPVDASFGFNFSMGMAITFGKVRDYNAN
ncbi:MAG: DUF5723 family protein [Rikenellaceae bacterium]